MDQKHFTGQILQGSVSKRDSLFNVIPEDKPFPVAEVKDMDTNKIFYLQRMPIGTAEVVGENVVYKGQAGVLPENVQAAVKQGIETAKKTKENVFQIVDDNLAIFVKDATPFLLHVDNPMSIQTEAIL